MPASQTILELMQIGDFHLLHYLFPGLVATSSQQCGPKATGLFSFQPVANNE
jgi:hypothetical protein